MTLDIPRNMETNISNFLSSERDKGNYFLEYVRLIFSNPNLTAKEYHENKLLESTINGWMDKFFHSLIGKDNREVEARSFAQRFMRAVGFSNISNWYLEGEVADILMAQSQRNYLVLDKDWIPVIESWYFRFRHCFIIEDSPDNGDVGNYYWAYTMGSYLQRKLSAETVKWWFDTFRGSSDNDGDPYIKYGMPQFLSRATFAPIEVLVSHANDSKARPIDMNDVMRYNYNLQSVEDFQMLNNLVSPFHHFKDWTNHNIDLDFYLMNRAANPALLEEIISANKNITASPYAPIDWDYAMFCQTIDYDFMLKYGAIDWLKSDVLSNPETFFQKLAGFIVNPNLSEADMQDLCRKTLTDWRFEGEMVLGLLPLKFVMAAFNAEGITYDDSDNNGFYPAYNYVLTAYLSNPNIEPIRDSAGQIDFNFLTGSDNEDLFDCPNHPASPFYFLSTSTFTNPAFTRRDLLIFLGYWNNLTDRRGGKVYPKSIGGFQIENSAHRMLATPLWVESELDIEIYEEFEDFNFMGYLLTGLFHAENLTVQDLVEYLKSVEDKADLNDWGVNPMYQFHLLANPNIFRNSSIGLFNWWGSIVR
jgi:hypothetical protein